jgi:hypothetical protein
LRNISYLMDVPSRLCLLTSTFKFFILLINISKVASVLVISYFNVHDHAPYVATGLINASEISIVPILERLYSLVKEKCTLCVFCISNTF